MTSTADTLAWQDDAGCGNRRRPADLPPAAWSPEGTTLTDDNRRAIDICRKRCPVRIPCEAAIKATPASARHGIWGGQLYEPNLTRHEAQMQRQREQRDDARTTNRQESTT